MLVNGKAETIPMVKLRAMFVNVTQEQLDELPSPRVLNTHFPPSWLPMQQIKGTCNKYVFTLRAFSNIFDKIGILSIWPRGKKTVFVFNSAEHDFGLANQSQLITISNSFLLNIAERENVVANIAGIFVFISRELLS